MSKTHGMCRTRIYQVWCAMIQRCYNPKEKFFYRYGGRGIKMCPQWRTSFINFLSDMGEHPTPAHTIERIDNDGDYEPKNCIWATRTQQRRNQSQTIRVIVDGQETSLRNACLLKGLKYNTIYMRIRINGLSPQVAIDTFHPWKRGPKSRSNSQKRQ